MKPNSFITKNLLLLSFISLFTDVASEMLYPIIPLYIASLGYGPVALGTIEGAAETISGLIKVFFGSLSDRYGKRAPFIQFGYGLSAFSKPFIGLLTSPFSIFGIRVLDRAGKGIRTAPRDALIIYESVSENRGKAFGFHRGMDSAGATLGPIVSLVLLYFLPADYRLIFFIAVIPGVISFIFTFFIREKTKSKIEIKTKPKNIASANQEQTPIKINSLTAFKTFWKMSSPIYKKLILGFLLLAILNSSNMFLILRARELGISDSFILISYILYNLVFACFSYPIGKLLDKYGSKDFYIIGILLFSIVYVLFGQDFTSPVILTGLFLLYGIFSAIEENVSKTWLSHNILSEYRATAIGLHLSINAVAFFVGSVAFGFVWKYLGAPIAFTAIALLSLPICYFFYSLKKQNP